MEIKWYWPAKMLGLVEDISHEYNDGFTHTRVSARIGEIFMYFSLALPVILFIIAFILSFILADKGKEKAVKKAFTAITVIVVIYSILLAFGVAPYIEFYPQGGGFIDLTVFENIIRGIYHIFIAVFIFTGSRLGCFAFKKLNNKP